MTEYKEYVAWDAPTRWFHWINALAVVGLIGTGLIILFDNALGLSASGKVTLKSVHALFGYVMALNLLWRFAWAFFGGRYARWRAIVPAGAGYLAALRSYTASFLSGEPQQYVGHNPLARIGVSCSSSSCSFRRSRVLSSRAQTYSGRPSGIGSRLG